MIPTISSAAAARLEPRTGEFRLCAAYLVP